jgi:hypothetical protein
MFRRILAKVLAERFVIDRGWSERQAIELGTQVLRGNVESTFRWGENLREELPDELSLERMAMPVVNVLGPITAPSEGSGGGFNELGFEAQPEGRLRTRDEEIVIPVPQPEEVGASEDVDLGLDTVEETAESPPALEVVAESDELDLDLAPSEATEAGGIHEDVAEPLEVELADAQAAAELEEIDEGSESRRETEPFPFKPASPNKPGGWDFLNDKK